MKRVSKGVAGYAPTLAAALVVATVFTFNACGGDDGDDPTQPINGNGNSSSSDGGSVVYTNKGNDIASYETVPIGDQVWMAENLNYKVAGSKCYGEGDSKYSTTEVQSNCDKYGRLYDWVTAMGLPVKCNSTLSTDDADCTIQNKHRGICPSGWHLPSYEDWGKLIYYVESYNECSGCAGKYLKAASGWNDNNGKSGNGEDTYGFSALPGGGFDYYQRDFYFVGYHGRWWSSSEIASDRAYYMGIGYNYGIASYNYQTKRDLHSVRCIKD